MLGYFLASRLALFVAAAVAARLLPAPNEPRLRAYLGDNLSLATWVRWDAWWYIAIAERGYWVDPGGQSSVAFFPVFPLLLKGLASLAGNPVVAGLLVANGAALAAVVLLWRWTRARLGPEAGERAVQWLCVYPFSFFLHTVYAESLYILLCLLALVAADQRRWAWAGLWGAIAAATRPMGVLLSIAFAWGIWRMHRRGDPLRADHVLAALLPMAGLGAYVLYLWIAFGDPLAFWTAHVAGWGVKVHFAVYWREGYRLLTRLPRIQSYLYVLDVLRIVLPVIFVVLTVRVYRRLGPVPGVYTGLAVAVGVLAAPESVGRELLGAVPAFAAAGLAGSGTLAEGLRLLAFGLLLILLFAFVTGHFVA